MSKRSAEEEIGTAEKKVCTEELNGNGAEHKEESIAELKAKVAANDSDKPTLYHMQHCSSCRPLVVIEELGIGDKVNVVTIASKEGEVSEHKKSEYLALNAHGTVPLFKVEDGSHMLESGAIAWYLLEKYGGKENALFGKPEQRAKLLQWAFYAPATFYPVLSAAYYEPAASNPEEKEKIKKKLQDTVFVQLARELGDNKYILGDEFTFADIMIGYELAGAAYLGWLDDSVPTLKAYMDRLNERPSFKKAFA